MNDAEKLIKRAGGKLVSERTHKVYLVGTTRFTIHHGTKPNPQEIYSVKKELRKLGLLN